MEYQKMINLLDNATNQSTKLRTKPWVEINDDSLGTYNANSQIEFKASMIRSSLCEYNDASILVSGTITVAIQEGNNPNNANKEVVFKNCAPFADCISEINITQIDNAKYIAIV